MMDSRTLRLMLGGLKSYFPALHAGYKGAVGRTTGAYCYSVWMRHLSIITRAVPSFRAADRSWSSDRATRSASAAPPC